MTTSESVSNQASQEAVKIVQNYSWDDIATKKKIPNEIRFRCHHKIWHWIVARQTTQSMTQAEPKDINDLFKE